MELLAPVIIYYGLLVHIHCTMYYNIAMVNVHELF